MRFCTLFGVSIASSDENLFYAKKRIGNRKGWADHEQQSCDQRA
jgi:hypothetical protein